MSWTDSHCHLDGEAHPNAVLRAARAHGVDKAICVGTSYQSSLAAIRIAAGAASSPRVEAKEAELPQVWASVGVHPHDAAAGTAPIAELLAEAVCAPTERRPGSVVAVGECGLDYHYDHSPRELQRLAFAEQIRLAKHFDLALIVHTREAWDDTAQLLVSEEASVKTIIHCFTGGVDEARRFLDLGFYLSFSGIVTFKNALEIRQAAAFCPLDKILVETDSPFLAPVPHRGQANQPAHVALVGEFIATLRNMEASELAAMTTRNAEAAFGLLC